MAQEWKTLTESDLKAIRQGNRLLISLDSGLAARGICANGTTSLA